MNLPKTYSRERNKRRATFINFWIYLIFPIFFLTFFPLALYKNDILLPKLFVRTVRKKCSSDQEKISKFEAEGREFAKCLRSLEQFIPPVKGQTNFCNRML